MLFKTYLQQTASLSEQEWEAASSAFTLEVYPKGGYYIREQQYCNKVSFIETGLFRLVISRGGKKIGQQRNIWFD